MLDTILKLILTQQAIQIILIAYVGALFGEWKKEVDDDDAVVFSKFLASWVSSGFGGVMVGLLLKGTVAKDNEYVVFSGAGAAGFLGHKVSFSIVRKVLLALLSNSEDKDKKSEKDNEENNK